MRGARKNAAGTAIAHQCADLVRGREIVDRHRESARSRQCEPDDDELRAVGSDDGHGFSPGEPRRKQPAGELQRQGADPRVGPGRGGIPVHSEDAWRGSARRHASNEVLNRFQPVEFPQRRASSLVASAPAHPKGAAGAQGRSPTPGCPDVEGRASHVEPALSAVTPGGRPKWGPVRIPEVTTGIGA